MIKIGKTANLRKRFTTLQIGSPDKLTVLGVIPDEQEDAPYHVKFQTAWVRGEWFKPSTELLAFLETLPKSQTLFGRVERNQPTAAGTPASTPPAASKSDRELFAAEVLKRVHACKRGSSKAISLLHLYVRLRGWAPRKRRLLAARTHEEFVGELQIMMHGRCSAEDVRAMKIYGEWKGWLKGTRSRGSL